MATAVAIVLLASGAAAVFADDNGQPARAVRLSDVEGQVTLSQDGQQLADQALANTPLFEGTQIVTGDDGRAEVQFEDGAIARIPPDSSLTLAVLRPGETEIDLNSGEGYFELQSANPDHPTRLRFGPNVVSASGFTVLRVQLDQQPGGLAIFSGNAHLEGPDNTTIDLHGGESVDLGQYNLSESIEPDSWDAWNSDRDQAVTSAEANTTAATSSMPDSSNPAWSDLNSNGTWYNTPDQGYVWSPYDASNAGWDPYGDGYWMDEPSYGYVWVSGYRWGYMPYQCGAWNYYSAFGWGWAPGGCSPWWGGGGGWGFNYGRYPSWYKPPFRPRQGPGPRGGPPGPHNPTPGRPIGHPVGHPPLIAVNRRTPSDVTALPPRDGRTPVTIGGSTAMPLRLTPSRQSFARASGPPQYSSHPQPVAPRPVYAPPAGGGRTTFAPQANPGNHGNPGGHPGYVPYYPQSGAHPSYNPPPPHPSGGSSPHPSGGGGGGSPHPSGGGGGSHPSGGGGGGGSHPGGGSHK
ncbi:MAG TPA: FecR family protein [Terracidiphilus sp.]|nr:FecR family protein [Terracidiphilus sp.]